MTRSANAVVLAAVFFALPASGATAQIRWVGGTQPSPGPLLHCDDDRAGRCGDVWDHTNYEGEYVGHDEPAINFYSRRSGSGNSAVYKVVLPRDRALLPTPDGRGGTFNFQLHPAFWFGMDLCDGESAPNFTKRCVPNSDTNIFDNPDPTASDFIGHHPGGAFLEVQFYPPGWIGSPLVILPNQYFASMNTFSLNRSQVTGQHNNEHCLESVGEESGNFSIITKDGVPLLPPNPLGLPFGRWNPDLNNVLVMNPGDTIILTIFDTRAGLEVFIKDFNTGESGMMVASRENGFGRVLFQPDPDPDHPSVACTVEPFAFHSMYSTSSEHTRITWTAHTSNVSFSDEIGHFEYCSHSSDDFPFACDAPSPDDPSGFDADDVFCFTPSTPGFPPAPFVQIGGCVATDIDFDGASYHRNWPGTLADPRLDARLHPEPIRFSSPQFFSGDDLRDFDRIAFEADFPAIERFTSPPCDTRTGVGCASPPAGAEFYPLYTTIRGGSHDHDGDDHHGDDHQGDDHLGDDHLGDDDDSCMWQFGGPNIPGTDQKFGGTAAAEFGDLTVIPYPIPGGSRLLYEVNRRVLPRNPCTSDLHQLFKRAIRGGVPGNSGF